MHIAMFINILHILLEAIATVKNLICKGAFTEYPSLQCRRTLILFYFWTKPSSHWRSNLNYFIDFFLHSVCCCYYYLEECARTWAHAHKHIKKTRNIIEISICIKNTNSWFFTTLCNCFSNHFCHLLPKSYFFLLCSFLTTTNKSCAPLCNQEGNINT